MPTRPLRAIAEHLARQPASSDVNMRIPPHPKVITRLLSLSIPPHKALRLFCTVTLRKNAADIVLAEDVSFLIRTHLRARQG